MYDRFVCAKNAEFLRRTTADLVGRYAKDGTEGFWIYYGSFVTNQQTSESDVDVLHVYGGSRSDPVRISASSQGHPVTLYLIHRDDYERDGRDRAYGGYFAGKALNPFVAHHASAEDMNLVLRTCGGFIGDRATLLATRRGARVATAANVTADVLLARFHLCPWLRSYVARWYALPSFPSLWSRMCEAVPECLIASGHVIRDEESFAYSPTSVGECALHATEVRAIARFWTLGSALHDNDAEFSEHYVRKCESMHAGEAGSALLRALDAFLQREAGLQ